MQQRRCKLVLRETSKPAKSDDVFFRNDPTVDDTFTLPSRNSAREVLIGQLANVVNH
jgi:hypothetical protein